MARKPAELTCPTVEIGVAGIEVKGFGVHGKHVCTLVINSTGVDVLKKNGRKPVLGLTWERFLKLAEEVINSFTPGVGHVARVQATRPF
jgi:hypothetical protein